MRLIDADRFYINYARRFSREPLKVELFKQFIDAEPTVDVLDKIRDEIEAIDITMGIKDYPFIPKAKVLDIIDKYTK